MAVLGRGLRETCAFYIRRTLVGAPLYAATLARYMRELIVHHAAPIEFFLEGTRSRSNKSLSPKYGMLSMSLAALFAGEVSDITIVPINISYDRLMEQTLFAYEHLGVPKPKESTGGFLKALNFLNDNFGNIYINMGKPLSVKNFFGSKLRVSKETLNPVEMQQISSEQFALVQELANYVVFLQQKTMVVTISNLLAMTLMHSIMRNVLLNIQELALEIEWAIDVLTKLDVTIFETDVKASIARILLVHHKTVKLDNNNKLRLIISDNNPIIMGESTISKMKGHTLKPSTMRHAVPLIQLQLYVNPLLHHLAPPAIIAVIVDRNTISIDQLAIEYNIVRKMLKYELLYLELEEEKTFKKAVQFCIDNDVIAINNNVLTSNVKTKVKQLLQWTVWPPLTVLLKCMEILRECISCEHKTALRLVQERVEEEGSWHPYCLSLEASANCLMGLHVSSAVIKEKKEKETLYTVVPNVMEEKYQLVKSILPSFDVPLSSSNSVYYNENNVASKL
ncbi:Dihydroxyacetone phosphate acyltransferase [Eumeta japonica]|uniref:Dihydroxyacetone phosphate acyltransferase n=1 Tax=Eumeta variegata TaxID=151549 RepID=A0A4C1VBI9_EUMVA|nr:Dihydroxyacetone phosphate acyltransferase [Eumeta japonica]